MYFGNGVNDIASGYFIYVPTGYGSIVSGRADPHAAHEHLVGISLLLQYPISPFEDGQLCPPHIGFAQLDPSGFRLALEVAQGSIPCRHMGYHRAPSKEIDMILSRNLESLLDRLHARYELGNAKGQGIIRSYPEGR